MGKKRHNEGDYENALKYYTKAAELGEIDAQYKLATMYDGGLGVDKDEKKEVYHLEKAAICGNPNARHNLAIIEEKNGNIERSVKHLIIAANLGLEDSMKPLWRYYSAGYITKEDLDATLRSHQTAIDAMKSEQRDAAEVVLTREARQSAIDATKSEQREEAYAYFARVADRRAFFNR